MRALSQALKLSPDLEVHAGRVRKRHDWQRWLPQAQSTSPAEPASASGGASPPISPVLRAAEHSPKASGPPSSKRKPGQPPSKAGATKSGKDAAQAHPPIAAASAAAGPQMALPPSVVDDAPPQPAAGNGAQQGAGSTQWRDAASKKVLTKDSAVQLAAVPPAPSSKAKAAPSSWDAPAPPPSAAARQPGAAAPSVARPEPLRIPPGAAAATSAEGKSRQPRASPASSAPTSVGPASSSRKSAGGGSSTASPRESVADSDDFGRWPIEAQQSDGWETSVGARRRRGFAKGAEGGADASSAPSAEGKGAAVHLKHVSADSRPLSGTRSAVSDEGYSEETQLLNEEDWSSAGSAEEPPTPSGATPAAAASGTAHPAAASPTSPKKRVAAGPGAKRGAEHKAVDAKAKSRGIKELRDAAPLEARVPSLLTSIDLDAILNATGSAATAATRLAAVPYAYALARTPRTQAWIAAHGTEPKVQLGFALFALLLLLMLPTDYLPPTLGELGASKWIEVPVGLVLALKFNDLGSRLWSLFTPAAVSSRHI